MSKAHYDALELLLPAGMNAFRGAAPVKPTADDYPYVVIGGNAGMESTEAAAGAPDSLDLLFKITYAGLTFDSVLIIMRQFRAAVLGARLVVPGWTCGTLRHEPALDVREDPDVTIPDTSAHPLYAVDQITLFSAR